MTVIPFLPYIEYEYLDNNMRYRQHKKSQNKDVIFRTYNIQVFEIDFNLTDEKNYGGIRYDYSVVNPILELYNQKSAKILPFSKRRRTK